METTPFGDTAGKSMNIGVSILNRPNCGLMGIESAVSHAVEDKGGILVCWEFVRTLQVINGNID